MEASNGAFDGDAPIEAVTPAPVPSGDNPFAQVGNILQDAIARAVSQSERTPESLEAVKREIATLKLQVQQMETRKDPLRIEVKLPSGEFGKIDNAHYLIPDLLKLINRRKNVYAYGLPGSGKSTAAKQVAESLKLPYGYISLNPQTPDNRLLGFMDLNPGNADTPIYRSTVFYRCYTEGGVFCIDELDNASASLLTTLNGMIENGHGAFPNGVKPKHPDFCLVATGNTTGRGADVLFPDRRVFDAAFMERFIYIEWPYDLTLEEHMVMSRNPKALPWMNWVRSARTYASREKIRAFFSPRCSRDGAELFLDGFKVEQVAEMAAFRGLNADLKAKILAACPLPKGVMA